MRSPLAPYATILSRPHFLRLWLSWSLSRLGDGIHEIALVLLVWQLTGSAALMATVAICSMAPNIVLAFVGGAFADRFDKKRIMVFCDAGRSILVLALIATYLSGWLNACWICVFAVLSSALETFFAPAQFAAIPATAGLENVQAAQGLMQSTSRMTMIAGPAIGAAIFGLAGPSVPFLANAVSFALSALVLSRVRLPESTSAPTSTPLTQDIRAGLSYVCGNRVILILLLMALFMNIGGAPLGIVLPVFSERLSSSAHMYGYMMAIMSAGMVLGFWQAGAASIRGWVAIVLASLVGLSFVALASSLWLPGIVSTVFAFAAIFVSGILMGMANVRIGALMQRATDPEYLGRVGSIGRMISLVASPLSLAAFGTLVDAKGPGLVLTLCGFLIILAGVPFVGSPLWHYRASSESTG